MFAIKTMVKEKEPNTTKFNDKVGKMVEKIFEFLIAHLRIVQ